jgi:two-component system chemotaxis response regulator CheB
MIRIMVAEDSAVARAVLIDLIREGGGFEIAGAADDGDTAVAMAESLRPDIILMDVYMPRLNGMEATRRIMETNPVPIVMTSANFEANEAELTFAALEAGALAIVRKPTGPVQPAFERTADQMLRTLRTMAGVRVVRRWPKRATAATVPAVVERRDAVEIVAIGVSTGGPKVLADILGGLPGDLSAPVLVVQHMAVGFIDGLVRWLEKKTSLKVRCAVDGEKARAGTIYIAPDGAQFGVNSGRRVALTDGPAENGFCPSASHLFRSVAEVYGRSALGILLTGMGTDGAAGLLALRRAGGMTVVQDDASCVVFGMPGEAIKLGAAEQILPPDKIAELIRTVARKPADRR